MSNTQPDKNESVERVVNGLAGVAFEGMEAVGNGISAIWNFNKSVLQTAEQIAEPLLKPLDALGVTNIVRQPAEAIASSVEGTVTRLEEKGRAGFAATEGLTIQAIAGTIDAVIDYLATHPAVDALITDKIDKILPAISSNPAVQKLVMVQVQAILPQLVEDPTIQRLIRTQAKDYLGYLQNEGAGDVQPLIRAQGDIYIDYLNEHPESVQNLVQGQSIGLATEMMDEVRERTVTADSVVEMLVRSVLRRKPREAVAPPPPQVMRRAEIARLPSDFLEQTTDNGGVREGERYA